MRAKKAQQKSEENYIKILKELPDIVYVINQDGSFVFLNNSIRVLGYEPEELIGKHFSKIVHPDDVKTFSMSSILPKYKGKVTGDENVPKLFDERRTGKRKTKDLEIRLLPKTGRKRKKNTKGMIAKLIVLGDVSSSGYYDADANKKNNKFLGTLGIIRDISKRKQVEEKLKKHQHMLETSEKELKIFSRRILAIKEEEKKKLSTNLHDEVGALTVALSSNMSKIEQQIKDKKLNSALETIALNKLILKKAVTRLRKLAVDLRPPDLEIIGLPDALREYFSNVTDQTDIRIDFSVDIDYKKLSENASIILYRIVQEALNNIIKHAEAKNVKVRLHSRKKGITLRVCDDGKGFDVEKNIQETKIRIGIRGMREMAESLDGTFVIKSIPKKGTDVRVMLPVKKKDKK
ncbi:MAG: PAS domain-containing sensor histidine kinase [Candidatus Cloacimonadota bacterium]|nr:MAG: PAS domain-containing sensor histidine kinase [Candidatus Cloacimonadota bacterium]